MAGEEAAGAQAAEDERAGAKRMAILLEKVMDRIASLDQKMDRIEKKCDASRRDGADSNKKHKSSGNKPSKEARRAVPFEWSRFTASDDDTDDAQRLNEKEAHELLQPYIEVRLAARFPIPCPLAIVLTYLLTTWPQLMANLAFEWFMENLAPKLMQIGQKDTMRIVYLAIEVRCSFDHSPLSPGPCFATAHVSLLPAPLSSGWRRAQRGDAHRAHPRRQVCCAAQGGQQHLSRP